MTDITKEDLLELLRDHMTVRVNCDTESYLDSKLRVTVRIGFMGETIAEDFDMISISE